MPDLPNYEARSIDERVEDDSEYEGQYSNKQKL